LARKGKNAPLRGCNEQLVADGRRAVTAVGLRRAPAGARLSCAPCRLVRQIARNVGRDKTHAKGIHRLVFQSADRAWTGRRSLIVRRHSLTSVLAFASFIHLGSGLHGRGSISVTSAVAILRRTPLSARSARRTSRHRCPTGRESMRLHWPDAGTTAPAPSDRGARAPGGRQRRA